MRTYFVDDITIHIGAEVVAVHHGGQTITPKEKRKIGPITAIKRLVKEYWRNSYFRTRTKAHLAWKGAEVGARCFGAGSLYVAAREEIWPIVEPWIPVAMAMIQEIDWPSIVIHFDAGFVIGVITTMIGIYCKKKTFEMMTCERGSKA